MKIFWMKPGSQSPIKWFTWHYLLQHSLWLNLAKQYTWFSVLSSKAHWISTSKTSTFIVVFLFILFKVCCRGLVTDFCTLIFQIIFHNFRKSNAKYILVNRVWLRVKTTSLSFGLKYIYIYISKLESTTLVPNYHFFFFLNYFQSRLKQIFDGIISHIVTTDRLAWEIVAL